MTKDEINRRCAEHDGWTVQGEPPKWLPPEGTEDREDTLIWWSPPDYTEDMNAAARIIDMAVEKNAFRYAELLDSEAYKVRYIDTGLNHHSNQIEWRLEKALEVLDD